MKSDSGARHTPLFDLVRRNQRARVARLGIGGILALLTMAFFNVQIVHHEDYARRSTSNQVRTIPLAAPRGILYDRDGDVIAENLPAYSASLMPPSEEALARSMQRLAPILHLDPPAVEELQRQHRLAPGQPVLLDGDLDYTTLSLLEELRSEIPGLLLQPKPRRHYPAGAATAHLTGYMAQIGEAELARQRAEGYAAGDLVGTTGLERWYESDLRGRKGAEYMEVDAMGRRVGPWAVKPFEAPEVGSELHLTVDLDLQRRAHEIFPPGKRGAIVALDPRTGEVLLLYSHPTFDPNLFSGRMTRQDWRNLSEDPEKPLINRAIAARYAPGSVFKLATAAMAMTLGVMGEDEYMDVPCRGGYQFGSRWFGCHSVHGWATLRDAIITSCDTYFYQIGLRLGLEELTRLGSAWQFDQRTGIDLPNESANLFPASTDWYDERYGAGRWGSGVVLNLSIGQGEIAVTPLKMVQFVSAVLNGGELLQPRLVRNGEPPEKLAQLPLSSDQFRILQTSLVGVVNDWRGTAFQRAHYTPMRYVIGGKSGTTEHAGGEPHAWFVAAGPMENPEIVVAILVEEGGSGSAQSPIAIDLIQTYLDARRGRLPDQLTPAPPVALSESGRAE